MVWTWSTAHRSIGAGILPVSALVLLCLLTASPPLRAALTPEQVTLDDSSRVVYRLDEAVWVLPREAETTVSTLRIPDAEMRLAASPDLGGMMRTLPGVTVAEGRKGIAGISLRGANRQSVRVLVDGFPLNAGYFGDVDLGWLPASRIEQVRVIKGPASVAYGPGALGGVVQIVTRSGHGSPPHGEAEMMGGDHGRRELRASAGGSSGGTHAWVSISDLQRDSFPLAKDFRSTPREAGGDRDNSDRRMRTVHGKLGRRFDSGAEIALSAGGSWGERGVPGSTWENQHWRFTDISSGQARLLGSLPLGSSSSLRASLHAADYADRLLTYANATYADTALEGSSRIENRTLGGSLDLHHALSGTHDLRGGLRYQADLARRRDELVGEPWRHYRTGTLSVYAEQRWRPSSAWELIAGAGLHERFASEGEGSREWSGMAALAWHHDPRGSLRLAVGREVFFPTMHNLYSAGRGNPDLHAERGVSAELGAERILPLGLITLHPRLSLFTRRTVDRIELDPVTDRFHNLGRTTTWGAEAILGMGFGDRLRGEAYAALLDWTTEEGSEALRQAHFTAGLRGRLHPFARTSIGVDAGWTGERETLNSLGSPVTLDPYLLLNATLRQGVTGWLDLKLSARNLLDAAWQDSWGYPAAGRTWMAGLALRWPPDQSSPGS